MTEETPNADWVDANDEENEQVNTLARKQFNGELVHAYIAGPIEGSGRMNRNVYEAYATAARVQREGLICFVPHSAVQWDMMFPADRDTWVAWSSAWLRRCDLLIRVPGESPGSDAEVKLARVLGLPCFRSYLDFGECWSLAMYNAQNTP